VDLLPRLAWKNWGDWKATGKTGRNWEELGKTGMDLDGLGDD
jgi:hypothetical protein